MRQRDSIDRRSAFTLVELVTVIVILGIMAAIVGGPTLAYMSSIRTHAAAARLAADIRFTQRTAMASGLRTWVALSTQSNSYQLFIEDAANPGKAGRQPLVHPHEQSSAPVAFGVGPFMNVSLASVNINGTSEVEFDNFGIPYDGAGVSLPAPGVVTLSGSVTVTIHPVGGYVERAG